MKLNHSSVPPGAGCVRVCCADCDDVYCCCVVHACESWWSSRLSLGRLYHLSFVQSPTCLCIQLLLSYPNHPVWSGREMDYGPLSMRVFLKSIRMRGFDLERKKSDGLWGLDLCFWVSILKAVPIRVRFPIHAWIHSRICLFCRTWYEQETKHSTIFLKIFSLIFIFCRKPDSWGC